MERKRLLPQHDKCADIFGGHPSMGILGARRGHQKGEKTRKCLFRDFRKKNGIAVIFREVTAMANRSGVQAKRAFLYHRRDFLVLNILNTQNRTDSGDTP